MSGELNHQEFRELVLDAYLTDPIPPITCMTDKALMRLEQLLRERYEAEAKSRREATLHVCHLKDAVCSERPSSWCDKCPKRPAAQTEREVFESRVTLNSIIKQYRIKAEDAHWLRASLPAPQQATPAEKFKTINCQVNGIDYTGEVRRVDENTVDIGRVVAFADEQATPEPLTLGPLAKRNIYDAIRGAYDLGYNDARNARTVPGDSAPGYDGRSVEEDHGGALFNTLNRRLAATPEPVGEPLSDVVEKKLRTLMGAVNSYEKATGIGGAYAETVQEVCNSLLREVGSKVKFGAGHENPVMPTTRPAPGVPEDVQRDAERYRFIRDANRSDCITREISLYAMESLDEYVDAAMEGETAALAAAQAKGGQA